MSVHLIPRQEGSPSEGPFKKGRLRKLLRNATQRNDEMRYH